MGYTEVFGGTNIYPADVSYLAIALTADIDTEWPMESAAPPYPLARIIDVIANGPHHIRLPNAEEGSLGAVVLFNCLTASSSHCFVTDFSGNVIATLAPGEQWEMYLTDGGSPVTPGPLWQVFRFGASTATVQPSALAGYGLTVTGSTLSQSVPVTTFNASPRTVLDSDRASALVWTGAGTGTLNLPSVGAVGNNFFVSARNAGGGMLNLDPLGTEIIDGGATVSLSPGEGVVLVTDGLVWYTLGRGQAAIFAFDYTAIDVTTPRPDPTKYVLTGAELNRVAYKFYGALTTNVVVIVPSTFQQYWVDNSTTGAFSLSLNTTTGVPVPVTQGSRGIYYSDGGKVVDADTGGISIPISAADGGTGQISYTIGDLLTASGPTTLARLADVPQGNALLSGGAGAVPLWGKINLGTHVVGTLPPANGGTGSTVAIGESGVAFATAGGVLIGDAPNFNWNNTTKRLGIGGTSSVARVQVTVADGEMGLGISGASKGLRIVPAVGGITIEGVDNSLVTSFQPLTLMGSNVTLAPQGGSAIVNGPMNLNGALGVSGAAVVNGALTAASGLYTNLAVVNTTVDNDGLVVNFTGGLNGVTGPSVLFNEKDGSGSLVNGGMVKSVCTNSTGGTSTMDMAFWTRNNGVFAERMRLSGAGVLYVNGAPVLTSGSSGAFLSSAVDVMINDQAGGARFYFGSAGTTYHISPTGHNFRINGPGGPDPVTIDTAGNLSVVGALKVGGTLFPGNDGNSYIQMSGGNPVYSFDTNDYMFYDRPGNQLGFVVGGGGRFYVTAGGAHTAGNHQVGGDAYATGTIGTNAAGAGNAVLQVAAAPQTGIVAFLRPDGVRLGYIGYATAPGGAIQYINEAGGGHHFAGGGINADATITTTGELRSSGSIFPCNLGNWYLGNTSGNPLINWDAGDYTWYNQASNTRATVIDGNTVETLDGVGNFRVASTVSARSGTNPYAALFNDPANGYLALFNGDGPRQGYIAAGAANGPVAYVNDRGAGHSFGGGDIAMSNSLTVGGNLVANGNVTAFSDARLKTNIKTIEGALDKVGEMRGVTFDRTDGASSSSGVIAQEVELVAPELVTTNEEGIKSVAYGNLVGYLIEAVKELRAEVAQLKADAGL